MSSWRADAWSALAAVTARCTSRRASRPTSASSGAAAGPAGPGWRRAVTRTTRRLLGPLPLTVCPVFAHDRSIGTPCPAMALSR